MKAYREKPDNLRASLEQSSQRIAQAFSSFNDSIENTVDYDGSPGKAGK